MTAARALKQDQSAAAHFLTLLDEGAEQFCFRVFDDNEVRKDPKLAAKFEGTLDEVWPRLASKQGQGCGVYVVANAGEQTNDTIYKVRAVFADTDGAPLEPILACGLEPHIIVESSPGKWHVYWLVDGLPTDAFRDIQRNIAAMFGTDKSVNDLARVMRLPGLMHLKGEPFLVRVIHESGALPYDADTIRQHFGVTATVPSTPPAPTLGQSVETNRHADVLKLTLMLAHSVRAGAMTRQEAFDLMRARRDSGRWSRHVPDDEISRALDGALMKGGEVAVDESAPIPQLDRVDLTGLMESTVSPVEFVVEPIIPRRTTTLLGGHGGVGKSMLALTLAAHVAAGRPWGPYIFQQGRAVVVSLEDDAEIVRYRLRRIIETCGLPADAVLANLTLFDGSSIDAELAVEMTANGVTRLAFTPVMDAVSEAVKGAAFVLIDNASDAYGGNENERRQVRAFVRKVNREARENNAALVLLAHIDKQAAKHGGKGNTYSGSTQWHNSVRSRLALVEADGVIELLHEKSNLGRLADPLIIQRGRHGVPAPATSAAIDAARALMCGGDVDAVMNALGAAITAGQTIPCAESGPHTTWHALCNHPELPAVYRDKDGKRRVWVALAALERAGRIRREQYTRANRHPGERWALAQTGALDD